MDSKLCTVSRQSPDASWEAGKTLATIHFVREAEWRLAHADDPPILSPRERHAITCQIELLKSGSIQLVAFESVGEFLDRSAFRDL